MAKKPKAAPAPMAELATAQPPQKTSTTVVTLTNTAKGPRGVHDAKGKAVIIQPGKSAEVELPATRVENWSKTHSLTIG